MTQLWFPAPTWSLQPSVTPVLDYLIPSKGLVEYQDIHSVCTFIQANTHINKISMDNKIMKILGM